MNKRIAKKTQPVKGKRTEHSITLIGRDAEIFCRTLLSPKGPNTRLREAANRHRQALGRSFSEDE